MRVAFISTRRNAYCAVILLCTITLLSKFLFNGLIFGLDYSLFHPDGTLYTFRTLNWMGFSQYESAKLVSDWYAQYAGKMTSINPLSLYFDQNPNWNLYKFRLLYSLLSIPFVYIFGINGMLVIPALSYLGMMLILIEMGFYLKRVTAAFVIIFLISISITITRWMFINTTDSLFAFLATLSTFLLLRCKSSKKASIIQVLLIGLMIATRVTIFFALPLILMLFFKNRKLAVILFVIVTVSMFPLFVANIQDSIAFTSSSGSLGQVTLSFVFSSIKLMFFELGQLLALDRVLLVILAVGLYLAFKNIRNDSSKFLLLSIFSTYSMSLLNGTVGVNFRFQLSIIGVLVWVILENIPAIKKPI